MDEKVEQVTFKWVEEQNGGEIPLPMATKRKLRSKKTEFHGWGSKPLIQFLDSIGKYTGVKLSQYEVTSIITGYVKERELLHPGKKKRILCDDRLQSLFGRKSVSRIKIYDLLEGHFAENQEEESEDEFECGPEDEEQTALEFYKPGTMANSDKKTYQKRNCIRPRENRFAAIIPENIKLVHLKRTVVLNLLKEPESFETKIVGSFVRVKADRNDYTQKNSHQILLVTGVQKTVDIHESGKETLLKVSSFRSDVRIFMLSEDNVTEEECEDLRQRVKEGLLKKPTVVELEDKARILREDIMKHWIERELALLQNLIDQANEKGWRKEMFEYLERKQNLQKPSEQSRLLRETPKVIPEDIELETTLHNCPDNMKEGNVALQRSVDLEASDILTPYLSVNENSNQVSGQTDAAGAKMLTKLADINTDFVKFLAEDHEPDVLVQKQLVVDSENNDDSFQGVKESKVMEGQIIDLSSDEEEDSNGGNQNQNVDMDPESLIWYYMDPQEDTQGPFSLMNLKRWRDANYFHPHFKIWKEGQTRDNAVLLSDLLCQIFPNFGFAK